MSWLFLLNFFFDSTIATAKEPFENNRHSKTTSGDLLSDEEGYMINFNNISMIEYIRFISKIRNINFVFDNADLDFNVTIVSEEMTSVKNIMSALIQILRIHNLTLLEQDNNFIITKSASVNQIPTLVLEDFPLPSNSNSAIITRVFRIKNGNPSSIAAIIRPMMSQGSLVEISNETRQLIVTDITTNVDKIASLLASLDAPHSPLEIGSYVAKNISSSDLVSLTTKIINPFAEGNPLILVPQIESNTIYIVSTPYLIERTLSIMQNLDTPFKSGAPTANGNIFLYKIQNKSADLVIGAIKELTNELQESSGAPGRLLNTFQTMRYIQDANSLLFQGDSETLAKVKEILITIDSSGVPGKELFNTNIASEIFLYKPKYATKEQLEEALKQLTSNLDMQIPSNRNLANAINTMRWIRESNSFFFKADPQTIEKLKELFTDLDNQGEAYNISGTYTVYLYRLEYGNGNEVLAKLKDIADHMQQTGAINISLIKGIQNIKWIQEGNSLLITGQPTVIEQIKELVAEFDLPTSSQQNGQKSSFFIYKPTHKSAADIETALSDIAQNLEESGLIDPDLLQTISSMRYVEATNSLIFTGTSYSLEKVKELIARIDISKGQLAPIQQIGELTFLIYKPQYVSPEQLISQLKAVAGHLGKSSEVDKELAQTIDTMKWIKETQSILFTGPTESLEKLEELLKKFDILSPDQKQTILEKERSNLRRALMIKEGPSVFVIYKPKYQTGSELITILCEFNHNLIQSGVEDQGLTNTIENLKWIEKTSTLLITGGQDSVTKVQELLERFDIPGKQDVSPSIEAINNTNFLIYKLQYHQGLEILDALKQISVDFAKSANNGPAAPNQDLLDTINSLQWIKVTNSLLGTGEQVTLTKLQELISNLDVPLRQVFIEVLVIETSLSNTQNFGLQWGGKAQYLNKVAMSTGNFPAVNPDTGGSPFSGIANSLSAINAVTTPTAAAIPFSSGFDLGVIGDIIMHKGKSFISLGSLVNALEVDNDSTIILNPKLITQDNNNSTIFVGQNIPFVGSYVTTNQTSVTQSANIEYRDVGLNLSITPILGNGNIVTLDIQNDISAVAQNLSSTNNSLPLNGLQTTHTSLNTRVHVPDQYFLALSGMIQDTKARFRSAIPCLGGLPVIGALFSENDRTYSKDNLIIFVRPRIINSFDEYREITEYQENLYKEKASLPILKEEFDAGVDMIKTPDDE